MDGLNLFSHFIAELALNPVLLGRYRHDPETVMEQVGLNDQEKDVLRRGDFKDICDFLAPTRDRPAPGDVQGGPGSLSGPGGGTG